MKAKWMHCAFDGSRCVEVTRVALSCLVLAVAIYGCGGKNQAQEKADEVPQNTAQKDDADPISKRQKACDKGDATGCNKLGLMYEKGKGVKQDKAKAATLYEKACEMGFNRACTKEI